MIESCQPSSITPEPPPFVAGASRTPVHHRIDLLSAIAVICAFGIYSAMFPVVSYDSWAYHFPFSSYIFNIGGGEHSFHPCPAIEVRYHGFPLFSEFVQGLAWKVTGSLRSVVIPQLVALVLLVYLSQRRLSVSPMLLLASFCMVPLLLIHTVSTSNDLISGVAISCGLVLVADIVAHRKDINPATWVQLIIFFSIGSATKYQGTFVAVAAIAALFVVLICLKRFRAKYLIWFIVASIFVGSFQIKNSIVHKNPFYPIEVKVAGKVIFKGPEPEYSQRPTYGPGIGAVYFLSSITELDWVERGVIPRYTNAMEQGDLSQEFGSARSGGFGQAYILAIFAMLIFQVIRWRKLDVMQRSLLSMSVFVLMLTSIMPQGLELRYWLYLPIFLNITTIRFMGMSGMRWREILLLLAPFALMGILSSYSGIWSGRYTFDAGKAQFGDATLVPKSIDYSDYLEFRNSRAVTGQNVIMYCKRK